MKALTYDGNGQWKVVEKPIPKVQEGTDAIVRMLRTTICGTDLHILKGDVPTVDVGRTLGHEGVGIVEETGAEVKVRRGLIIFSITYVHVPEFQKGRPGRYSLHNFVRYLHFL